MSAPKPPKPKEVNPYEGMDSDPMFYRAQKDLGISKVDKAEESRRVRERMFELQAQDERVDKQFRKAEKQLYKDGMLKHESGFATKKDWRDNYIEQNYGLKDKKEFKQNYIEKKGLTGKGANKQAQAAYEKYVAKQQDKAKRAKQEFKQNYIEKKGLEGPNANKKAKAAYDDYLKQQQKEQRKESKQALNQEFSKETGGYYGRSTDTDWEIQKVFDQMYDNEAAKADKQYQKDLKKQAKQYQKQQEAAMAQSQAQFEEQMAAQKLAQDEMAAQQKELMEAMMNQPVFSAKQAALPSVQYQPETPDPMPVAPAPPPAMNIQSAPPPELTNIGNQMSIVRQSSTAKQRSRRRTRGTSTLRN